jgi:prepilin-type N-terminal cleavage/methylation domain-containing protein
MKTFNDYGITLIELIVVISIIGILVVALGFEFQGWMGSYRAESQTKEMYVDLMNAKARAMQRNRVHFVVVNNAAVCSSYPSCYQIYEDTDEDGVTPPPIDTDDTKILRPDPKPLSYPSLWTGTVTMNTRGLVSPNNTIRFDIGTNNPDYDCIVLSATRINMGKWDGANCVAK